MDTNKILELNRNPELSSWFLDRLEDLKNSDVYHDDIPTLGEELIKGLSEYRTKWNVENVFLGMSGGIDSALTAALFKNAGWNVTGLTLPIHQDPSETERGIEACESLGIEHLQVDLTQAFESYLEHATEVADANLHGRDFYDSKDARVRGGNIRARLRMITLYNLAEIFNEGFRYGYIFSFTIAGFYFLLTQKFDFRFLKSKFLLLILPIVFVFNLGSLYVSFNLYTIDLVVSNYFIYFTGVIRT